MSSGLLGAPAFYSPSAVLASVPKNNPMVGFLATFGYQTEHSFGWRAKRCRSPKGDLMILVICESAEEMK